LPNTGIAISFTLTLLIPQAGCRLSQGHGSGRPDDLSDDCGRIPYYSTAYVRVQRTPTPDLAVPMADQVDAVVRAVFKWLSYDQPVEPACLLVFSPRRPEGRAWLKYGPGTRDYAGATSEAGRIMVVVADPHSARFWTILRHEAAHFALRAVVGPGRAPPFWLDEGVACLFEPGVDAENRPKPNPERLKLLRYLARTRRMLHLKTVLNRESLSQASAREYARAWGIVAYLYHQQRAVNACLQTLPEAGQAYRHFEDTILRPDQTLEGFEQAVRRWINP